MAKSRILPARTSSDPNAAADVNELSTEALDYQGTEQVTQLTEETSPANDDLFLMERDSDGALRKVKTSNMKGTDAAAIHDNVAGEINAVSAKGTPIAADKVLIEDSADSWNKKSITLTNLLGGGGSGTISTKTASYTITDVDGIEFLYFSGLSADATATLPTAADNDERKILVKNLDSTYDVIVDGESAEEIDGVTTKKLGPDNDWIYIICDGTKWNIIAADYKVNGIFYYDAQLTSNTNIPVTSWTTILSYTIPEDAIYEVSAFATLNNTTQSDRFYCRVVRGASDEITSCFSSINYSANSDYTVTQGNVIISLTKGDSMTFQIYSYFGGGNSYAWGSSTTKGTGWSFKKVKTT